MPPEALEHHRSHAKRNTDTCTIEIRNGKRKRAALVTSGAEPPRSFALFEGGWPPAHRVFKENLQLSQSTTAGGFHAWHLERLGKVSRACDDPIMVFAGQADAIAPCVFTCWQTDAKEPTRWTVLIRPVRGCEVLAAR